MVMDPALRVATSWLHDIKSVFHFLKKEQAVFNSYREHPLK